MVIEGIGMNVQHLASLFNGVLLSDSSSPALRLACRPLCWRSAARRSTTNHHGWKTLLSSRLQLISTPSETPSATESRWLVQPGTSNPLSVFVLLIFQSQTESYSFREGCTIRVRSEYFKNG